MYIFCFDLLFEHYKYLKKVVTMFSRKNVTNSNLYKYLYACYAPNKIHIIIVRFFICIIYILKHIISIFFFGYNFRFQGNFNFC